VVAAASEVLGVLGLGDRTTAVMAWIREPPTAISSLARELAGLGRLTTSGTAVRNQGRAGECREIRLPVAVLNGSWLAPDPDVVAAVGGGGAVLLSRRLSDSGVNTTMAARPVPTRRGRRRP